MTDKLERYREQTPTSSVVLSDAVEGLQCSSQFVPPGEVEPWPLLTRSSSTAYKISAMGSGMKSTAKYVEPVSLYSGFNSWPESLKAFFERFSYKKFLWDALQDLSEVKDEALEEGYPVPSKTAFENAERLLRAMHRIWPGRLAIYPSQGGRIAINAPGGYRRSVMVLCESEGGAVCMVNAHGVHRRAHYDTAVDLPDGFIREALEELGPAPAPSR